MYEYALGQRTTFGYLFPSYEPTLAPAEYLLHVDGESHAAERRRTASSGAVSPAL
jgi:hypothetical protein